MKSLAAVLLGLSLAASASAQVAISQIHADSTEYDQNFVELFNRGNAPVNVDGWSIKVTAGNGSFWSVTPLSGVIPAHSYYLIAMGGANGSRPLPPAQANGSSTMYSFGGKMILSNDSGPLVAFCPSLDSTIDLVLWGTVNCEPANPAPIMDGTNAIFRANGGCTDTNNDTADFTAGPPAPRNTSITHSCTTGPDCNGNGIDDTQEVAANPALDCNANGIPDTCDVASNPSLDCNSNGIIDCADYKSGALTDVNADGVPDVCQGALVFEPHTVATVTNAGVSTDTTFWRIQGAAVEDAEGRPAPSFGALRWSIPPINNAIAAQLGQSGWYINDVYLSLKMGNDPINGSGSMLIYHTDNDSITLAPGTNAARYSTLASTFNGRTIIESWPYTHAAGQSAARLLYMQPPQSIGASDLLDDITIGTGDLTVLVVPSSPAVAAPFAGASHPTMRRPQLVVFAYRYVTCCTSDYNGDGDFGTDADIEAFFACLAGTCCPTCWASGSDVNGDGDFGTDADIEAFFRILAGSPC